MIDISIYIYIFVLYIYICKTVVEFMRLILSTIETPDASRISLGQKVQKSGSSHHCL